VKKSRRIRWTERAGCLAERRFEYMVLECKPEGHRPLGKLDVDGKIILKVNL